MRCEGHEEREKTDRLRKKQKSIFPAFSVCGYKGNDTHKCKIDLQNFQKTTQMKYIRTEHLWGSDNSVHTPPWTEKHNIFQITNRKLKFINWEPVQLNIPY